MRPSALVARRQHPALSVRESHRATSYLLSLWLQTPRIYAAIETRDTVHHIAHRLFRYSANGTFETDLNVPSQSLRSPQPLAFGSDGRLTTVGMNEAVQSSTMRGRVSRYLTTGALDPAFGGGVGYVDGVGGNGVIVQSDAKPVIVGSGPSIARLTTGGALDNGFDQSGVVTAGFGARAFGVARTVTVAVDGSIIAAGVPTQVPAPLRPFSRAAAISRC